MILLTGARGFVGHKILSSRQDVVASPSLRDAGEELVKRVVEESGADIIVHTAAISDVGACEKDPEASYRANVLLPLYLAKAAGKRKLVCFSSDQVYTGSGEEGPYTEEMAAPGNTYARHKLEMEERVLDLLPDAVMLRAEWMYDEYVERNNYYMQLTRGKGPFFYSSRQYRGVTYLKEVVENLDAAIRLPGGAYNFGSETTKPIREITQAFLEAIGREEEVRETEPRHNLWVNCDKARRGGVVFSEVSESLLRCARDYGLIKN